MIELDKAIACLNRSSYSSMMFRSIPAPTSRMQVMSHHTIFAGRGAIFFTAFLIYAGLKCYFQILSWLFSLISCQNVVTDKIGHHA